MSRRASPAIRRRYIIRSDGSILGVRYGVGLHYGRPDGGPLMRWDKKRLRDVNGIWVNWPTGALWLLFRRPSY